VADYDDRRLWPGTSPPVAGSPRRRRGSIRRTTVLDGLRPEGIGGPLVLVGTGRDLATGIDGEAYLVDAAATSVVVDVTAERTVRQVVTEPPVAGLEHLAGTPAGSGFRRALATSAPDLAASGSLLHQLLDDTPPATLLAGSVLARLGLFDVYRAKRSPELLADVCAGWVRGGSMLAAVAETGIPLLGWGPPAPSLVPDDDELAWHPVDALAPHSMRRRRLVDVWRGVGADGRTASAPIRVDVRFRDTYGEDDGTETVVHEYGVTARIDPDAWTVLSVTATPGPLPAPECPSAAASVDRVVGLPISELRDVVRAELSGPATCTHLNDVLRSLADVQALWAGASLARGERGPDA
jgi:hypothetical protein